LNRRQYGPSVVDSPNHFVLRFEEGAESVDHHAVVVGD
jgi:hypothetical protein